MPSDATHVHVMQMLGKDFALQLHKFLHVFKRETASFPYTWRLYPIII